VLHLTNLLTGDPAFVPDGFHLTQASDAIDAGIASGVTQDFDGQPRPINAAPDLGADEYPEILPLPAGSGQLPTPDGTLTFVWSLAQPITLTYASQPTTTNQTGDFTFAGTTFHLEAFDQNGVPLVTPSTPLTLTVNYDDASLPPGTIEASLELYRYDATLHEWLPLTVLRSDTAANTLTVLLDHFSEFALLAPPQLKIFLPITRKP
jgi:hypothetical protein